MEKTERHSRQEETSCPDIEFPINLLAGLDEYYSNRKELLCEGNQPQKTIVINGITHIAVDSTIEKWAKSVGAVSIDDIQWQN